MVSIPCVLFESLCIFTQGISAHTGLGLLYVNTPLPCLSAASEGVDAVRSTLRLTALDYINVNFAPTGCLLIMAISRSQCCFDPIGLPGEPSQFVLILSLIRSEEPIRISCAGFLEVGYFLILIIMRWWVISRSPRLSFVPSCSCIPCFPSITSSFGLLLLLMLSEHGVKRTWTIFAHLLRGLKWECHFQAYLRCVHCQKYLKQGSKVWLIKTKRANFKHLTCLAV